MPKLEKRSQTSPHEELERIRKLGAHLETAMGQTPTDEWSESLSEEQKQEILRRRADYLANPSIATPWHGGTAEHLIKQLRARRSQKAAPSRS